MTISHTFIRTVKNANFMRVTFCMFTTNILGLPRKFDITGNGGTTALLAPPVVVSLMLFSESKPIIRDLSMEHCTPQTTSIIVIKVC